jgi:hypothetical protein
MLFALGPWPFASADHCPRPTVRRHSAPPPYLAPFSAGFSAPPVHHAREMSKRRKILLLLAGLVLAFGAHMLFFREKELTY